MTGTGVSIVSDVPDGLRAVPVLTDHQVGHYPEFVDFLVASFTLDHAPWERRCYIDIEHRFYELVFLGRSGRPFPSGVEVDALIPGLEPLNEDQVDADLWVFLQWLVAGVGGAWRQDELLQVGRIYRIAATQPD